MTFKLWTGNFRYGNEIFFKAKVAKINVEGDLATSVQYHTRGKEYTIKAKHIIAACDVESLYEKMLPEGTRTPKFLKKLKDAKLYSSAVTLSIALDCTSESLGFGEEVLYLTRSGITRDEEGSGDPHKCGIHVLAPSVRDKTLAPDSGGTLTIFAPGYFDDFDRWKTETGENGEIIRGEAYKKLKQEVADILLDRIESKLKVDVRSHIVYLDIATPITHQRYTGNRAGTMMGAKPGKENMQAKIAHYRTPIKNLYLGGHWAELGGGIPIAVRAAVNSSLLLLKKHKKEAFNLLAKYIDREIESDELDASELTSPYSNNWEQKPTPATKKDS